MVLPHGQHKLVLAVHGAGNETHLWLAHEIESFR